MNSATLYRKIRVGDYVKLRRELRNGGGFIFAAGRIMRVEKKHNGLELETVGDKPCPACGIGRQQSISRVPVYDIEHLPGHVPERTAAGGDPKLALGAIKALLRDGALFCKSGGEGAQVTIKFLSLTRAQELHRLLVEAKEGR